MKFNKQVEAFLLKATFGFNKLDLPQKTIGYGGQTTVYWDKEGEMPEMLFDPAPENIENLTDFFKSYGWSIKTGKDQVRGSCADIFAQYSPNDGEDNCFLLIEDGYVTLEDAAIFIWEQGYTKIWQSIFAGQMQSISDLEVLFRMIGFDKINI